MAEPTERLEVDVIVIGGGGAGLAAASEAAGLGRRVLLLEKNPALGGSIINVSSTYGVVAPTQSLYDYRRTGGAEFYKPVGYSVAKSGMLNFTRWLAEYGAPFGLRVNTLVPGGVREDNHAPEFVAAYERHTPLGRMANEDDYNGAVLFLASRASAARPVRCVPQVTT